MKKHILIFILTFLNFNVFAGDCSFDPENNAMASEYKSVFSSDTFEIKDHWYYTASGTINPDYKMSQDDNFFEVKMLDNRYLVPRYKFLGPEKNGVYYYGPDFYGHKTRIIRIFCPMVPSSSFTDPYNGIGLCSGKETDFFEVVGSSTILKIKKGRNRVKEIK